MRLRLAVRHWDWEWLSETETRVRDLPPVTRKYEAIAMPNTVMADGIWIKPGFFNFNLGHSRRVKGKEYRKPSMIFNSGSRLFNEKRFSRQPEMNVARVEIESLNCTMNYPIIAWLMASFFENSFPSNIIIRSWLIISNRFSYYQFIQKTAVLRVCFIFVMFFHTLYLKCMSSLHLQTTVTVSLVL